ncbi:Superfamily I DNA and/or RNA helicase [Lishizhenia tianjinensis]|uniref:Superfamily I DNA and/or RNA helicase n=1 Tax=Lishizhenia tianjinensis TaxID=477690 RepID=A0A1I6ZUC2_9FLAO|nr:AAA domain-containing protein [Lishizhenia tianjinensis]SFT66273.1 Superfamily I DNA and/or RNA helicase [Lishizhenia tianjinensis]
MTLQNEIQNWAQQKITQSTKDPLVNFACVKNSLNLKSELKFEFKSVARKLFLEAEDFRKNSGVETLCFVEHLVKWHWKGEEILTPIFLTHVSYKKVELGNCIVFTPQPESNFINPFLQSIFRLQEEDTLEDVKSAFNREGIAFEIHETSELANVHPYRINILRELQAMAEMEINPSALSQIMGHDKNEAKEFAFQEALLTNADADQIKVFKTLENEDVVLQGPPGTGKSQTITNVLAKALGQGCSALLSSEKSVALTVIYEKFKAADLHHFLCFYKGKQHKKVFVQQLKEAWLFLENHVETKVSCLQISELEIQQLDNRLARLNSPTAIGGMSWWNFKELLGDRSLDEVEADDKLPDLKDWMACKEEINFFLQDEFFKVHKSWADLPLLVFEGEAQLNDFIQNLEKTKTKLELLFGKELSIKEVQDQIRYSDFIHLFFYDEQLIPKELLVKESAQQKAFYRTYNSYSKLVDEQALLLKERDNWKKNISLSEIHAFIDFVESEKGLRFSHFRVKNKLKKLTHLHYEAIPGGLQNLKRLEEVEAKLVELKAKLRKQNLPEEINHLRSLKNTVDRSKSTDDNVLKSIIALTDDERIDLHKKSGEYRDLRQFFRNYFQVVENDKNCIAHCDELLQTLPFCFTVLPRIQRLDKAAKYAYKHYENLEGIELRVVKTAWLKFKHLNPDLAQFDGEDLNQSLQRITEHIAEEQHTFTEVLKDKQKAKFEAFNNLLSTPAAKLSEEEKVLKRELRIGKKILINEFGKTRRHKSLLELMTSEARHWMKAIQPIFLLNTFQVADTLPLEQNLLDLLVLDEASQIPFTHALGSVFRAKRCLITGDSQQMSPSMYFERDTEEGDILHHASFQLKSLHLKHHYRSKHSELITFSNRHFYANELQVFPSPATKVPAIEVVDLVGAMMEKGNKIEAQALAEYVGKLIAAGQKDLGIVCFNEKQLKLLYKTFTPEQLIYLEDEANNCFIKTLEKVQGDECRHLIISTTYAPNKDGEFAMRFGPLNKVGGEKRLNVLMTRAQERITCFRSFAAKDMKLSTNTGVETLRKLMTYLEAYKYDGNIQLAEYLEQTADNTLCVDVKKTAHLDSRELLTQHTVLSARGWSLSYRL